MAHSGVTNVALYRRDDMRTKEVVDNTRTSGLRKHKPQVDSNLNGVIEGNPRKEDVGKRIQKAEEAENYPVSKPLLIVVGFFRLKGLDTSVRRVPKPHKFAQESHPKDEVHETQTKDYSAGKDKHRLDAPGFFRNLRHTVDFLELRVQPICLHSGIVSQKDESEVRHVVTIC